MSALPEQLQGTLAEMPLHTPELRIVSDEPVIPTDLLKEELDVTELIAAGLTLSEIAARLAITEEKLTWFARSILSKMGVTEIRQIKEDQLEAIALSDLSQPAIAGSLGKIIGPSLIGNDDRMIPFISSEERDQEHPPVEKKPSREERRLTVLHLSSMGLKRQEIARELAISLETVSSDRRKLFEKYESKGPEDAVVKALGQGDLERILSSEEIAALEKLTPTALKIVRQVARGLSNSEIAEVLDKAETTVDSQVKDALHKLGAKNRVHLSRISYEAGLLDEESESLEVVTSATLTDNSGRTWLQHETERRAFQTRQKKAAESYLAREDRKARSEAREAEGHAKSEIREWKAEELIYLNQEAEILRRLREEYKPSEQEEATPDSEDQAASVQPAKSITPKKTGVKRAAGRKTKPAPKIQGTSLIERVKEFNGVAGNDPHWEMQFSNKADEAIKVAKRVYPQLSPESESKMKDLLEAVGLRTASGESLTETEVAAAILTAQKGSGRFLVTERTRDKALSLLEQAGEKATAVEMPEKTTLKSGSSIESSKVM